MRAPAALTMLEALRERVERSLAQRQVVRAHLWQSAANYWMQGASFAFGVVMARVLTPEDFGRFAFAMATTQLCLLPASWSLSQMLVADGGKTPGLFTKLAGFAWKMAGFRLLIIVAVCAYMALRVSRTMASLAFFIGFPDVLREVVYVRRCWLEGQGNFKVNFLSAIFGTVFSYPVALAAALGGLGTYALVLAGWIALLVDLRIYTRATGFGLSHCSFERTGAGLFRQGFWLWLNSVADVGFQRIDKWFLGRLRGEDALGHYSRAFNYAPLSHLLLNSLMTNPTASALARCADLPARRTLFRKTALIVLAGGALNWILFRYFSGALIPLLFGPRWSAAIPLFEAFAGLSFAYGISYLPAAALLGARRYRALGALRATFLVLLGVGFLAFGARMTTQQIAYYVQGCLLAQGVVLFAATHGYLWSLRRAAAGAD